MKMSTWLTVMAAWVVHGIHADAEMDETKARLIATYHLPTTRPTLAATRLGLDEEHNCAADAPPTRVKLQVYVTRFHQLDQDAQTYGFDGYFRAWWNDPRLRFNSTQCIAGHSPELSLSRQEAAQIWKPDFYWEGSLKVVLPDAVAGIKDGAGESLTVSTGGDAFWSRQARFTLACPMRLLQLPFDTQRCAYTVGVYSDKAEQVTISWREDVDAIESWSTKCLSQWVVTSLEQKDVTQTYASGNYSYVRAHLSFTRIPDRYIFDYMLQSVVMVVISCLGFLIDPYATPARVALGIITVMVVLQNYIALSSTLPAGVGVQNAWLGRFVLTSFYFNVAAFIEQVLVSYGIQAFKWLEQQRAFIASVSNWQGALRQNLHALFDLFTEWDTNGDGQISKKEFRKGVQALYPTAPPGEVNAMFDSYTAGSSGAMELGQLMEKMQQEYLPPSPRGKEAIQTLMGASRIGASRLKVPHMMPAPNGAAVVATCASPTLQSVAKGNNSAPQAGVMRVTGSDGGQSAGHDDSGVVEDDAEAGRSCRVGAPQIVVGHEQGEAEGETEGEVDGGDGACVTKTYLPPAAAPAAARRGTSKRRWGKSVFTVDLMDGAEETRKARQTAERRSKEELGQSRTWAFKTFYLFPCLVRLRHLDHISRFIFPCAYVLYLLIHFSSINFGRDQHELLKDHHCYHSSS